MIVAASGYTTCSVFIIPMEYLSLAKLDMSSDDCLQAGHVLLLLFFKMCTWLYVPRSSHIMHTVDAVKILHFPLELLDCFLNIFGLYSLSSGGASAEAAVVVPYGLLK